MRVAVTGGLGFLGRALCRVLRDLGHRPVALDHPATPGDGESLPVDVGDAAAVSDAIARLRPDAVVHLAALLTPASRADIVAATRVNALGTANVFAAARAAGVRRIVYASSVAALGLADGARDDAAPQPRSVYGATKAFGEHLAAALAADDPGLTLVGLRLGWVYGPGRERGWRIVQEVIEQAARGEKVVRYPDFRDALDWTWIDDAAAIVARAVLAPLAGHHVLNVAGDKRTMAEAVAHLRRRYPRTLFEPYAAETPPSSWGFANDGLQAALGAVPRTRMEDGIDRLIDALRR